MLKIIDGNRRRVHPGLHACVTTLLTLVLCGCAASSLIAGTAKTKHYSDDPLAIEIAGTEADVEAAIQEVASDKVVHGTYSYEHDKYLSGAKRVEQAPLFGRWTDTGKVFYKVAENVISPRHFRDTADMGTVSIRYVVQPVDEQNTRVLIEAAYVETAHRELHPSDGNVEVAEFAEIREHLDKIVARRNTPRPSRNESSSKQADLVAPELEMPDKPPTAVASESTVPTGPSVSDLEQKVAALRKQVEARVVAADAHLKAAPYKGAANIAALPKQSQVVVLIVTKYWFGIETTDGQHGWIHRSQLEFVQ